MKAVPIKKLKEELKNQSSSELLDICLRLSKFKKENKELLTYLLFEKYNEDQYVESIKIEMDNQFDQINKKSFYYIRKSVRKILSTTKKFIQYSQNKETEVDLLIYFCSKLKDFKPSISKSARLQNTYNRQIAVIKKVVSGMHEDLQYDYNVEIEALEKR